MERSVRALAPGRAAGPDGIPPRILHLTPDLVARCLIALWEGVGRLGELPPTFSAGRITPVNKKGDALQPCNYRPITVLNVCRRVVSAALDDCIRSKLVLHKRQWGFRKRTGTVHAISHLEMKRRRGRNHTALLDLRSAYDLTPRSRVRDICRLRLPPDLAAMVETILSPTHVHVTGAPNQNIQVTSGVPQGDPVSPTLFNIFIDVFLYDLDDCIKTEDSVGSCYADDVVLSCATRPQLQHALDVATRWATENRMAWNVGKSCVIEEWNAQPRNPLLLCCQALPSKESATYLGVELTPMGVSSRATKRRIDEANRRLSLIISAEWLRNLSFHSRRYIARAHVVSLVDYASHLSPLPASLQSAAAQLERRICGFVLNSKIPPHATIRARALARIPPLIIRRRIMAGRCIHAARRILSVGRTYTLEYDRAYALNSSRILTEAANRSLHDGRNPHIVRRKLLLDEWNRANFGARPIYASIEPIHALQHISAELLHTVSRFYLNTIPAEVWRTLPANAHQMIRSSLFARTLTDDQLSRLQTQLKILKSNMV